MYPRHFGVTFREAADFEALHELAVMRKVPFFAEVSTRFEAMAEEHRTFVLRTRPATCWSSSTTAIRG